MSSVTQGPWSDRPSRSFEQFEPFSPISWGASIPPRPDWMVEGCFLRGTVAILAGDGGLGKSLLCQQLITAAALGAEWLGLRTVKARSLAVFCEDDREELHRRQANINEHYGCQMKDLAPVLIESRAARDSIIMRFKQWGAEGQRTFFFDQIEQKAVEHKAQIIILDTLADVFDGNEVDRNQPRRFIRELRKLAIRVQGIVILTQHPSVEGLASGTGRSGSTGWNNSVRSRLYLTTPPKNKTSGADDGPTNERLLKTMKNNHGPWGGKIKLVWSRGVFIRQEDQESRPYYRDRDDEWQQE